MKVFFFLQTTTTTTTTTILLLLSIIPYYLASSSALNPNFSSCNQTISCGALSNITYPFYDSDTRPEYCGYPGFQIQCIDNNTLQLYISRQTYNILSINPASTILTVARNDILANTGCPSSATNTTIDFSLFNFTSADEYITIFYGCSRVPPSGADLFSRPCEYGLGYFLTPEMLAANGSYFLGVCRSMVVPFLREWVDEIEENWTAVATAFNSGFELGWSAQNSWCLGCVESGGLCGYDSGRSVCHCQDQDYSTRCGVDPVVVGGKNNKLVIGIGVGAGLGVALLLVAGWSLFARRRNHNNNKSQLEVYPAPPYNSTSTATTSSGAGYTTTTTATTPSTYQSRSMPSYSSKSDIETGPRAAGGGGTTYFGVRLFSYTELKRATDNFERELGDGGFGTVYYGQLPDGQPVAVKRLYENSFKRVEQSFMNEIEILAKLRHDHLVTLYGCTSRHSRDLLLVYEYVPNGTVADHLHGKRASTSFLPWSTRLSIATETAQALLYLHRSDIIHRDVKTANILLGDSFRVKVADFGLSRLFPNDVSHVSTAPQGTPGYVDPEYFQCYRLTEKSDVYSFGVVLVELVSSKEAVDITRHRHDINLSTMAVDRIKSGALKELVDPRIEFEADAQVERAVKVVCELAFRCLQHERDMRPSMQEVVDGLIGLKLRDQSFNNNHNHNIMEAAAAAVAAVSPDLIDVSPAEDDDESMDSRRPTPAGVFRKTTSYY